MSALAPHVAILAGGAGARMKGGHPKALHPVFFRPMIHYILDAATAIPHRSLTLVVGRGEREFREQCRGYADLRIVRQDAPSGTADAVRALESELAGQEGDLLILSGDAVLLTPSSLQGLLATHAAAKAACTVGRGGTDTGEADAHCFRVRELFDALRELGPRADGGALGLEDAVAALASRGRGVADHRFADPLEAATVEDLNGLSLVEETMQARYNRELMLKGVELKDPRTTLIDPRCRIGREVRIEGGCTVIDSTLEAGAQLESHCRVIDSEIGVGSRLRQGTCVESSHVGRECRVGPYAHLRHGTHLDDAVWVGNFVEIVNATLGAGTRAGHLSYISDALIGRSVDIGCGFITCNASGRPQKSRTVIGDGVFIGSATQALAPVTVGAGSFIATGTSVTDDVPPDSFVISRGRQVTKPGYSKKYGKPKGPAAPR